MEPCDDIALTFRVEIGLKDIDPDDINGFLAAVLGMQDWIEADIETKFSLNIDEMEKHLAKRSDEVFGSFVCFSDNGIVV